tara:strand:+ start:8430 stop:8858 length:429 start_codon:yes stop_codon:yes gene_type:complete
MPGRNATLAKIHIAKKELGLDDDVYKAKLMQITGKDSAAKMNREEHDQVLRQFENDGWKKRHAKKVGNYKKPSKRADVRKIFALWWGLYKSGCLDCSKANIRSALNVFVKNMFDVDDPEWLSEKETSAVIEALKSMKKRKDK